MSKLEVQHREANDVSKAAEWTDSSSKSKESFDWPSSQTFIYREVDGIQIEADVYVPTTAANQPGEQQHPVALFIHGGGWVGGIRTDFPKPTLYEFLTRGFVFVSIDYRLLPEVDFRTAQLDDIAWAETWIREKLQSSLQDRGFKILIKRDSIVVVGGSAGAHLASLTPRIWKAPPKALLLLAGPTNLLDARSPHKPLGGGKLNDLVALIPLDPTPEFIKSASFATPRTNTIPASGLEGFMHPRSLLGLSIFFKEVYPEFLARGIVDGKLPEKGSVPEEELKSMSAFFADPISSYPPTFQIIGDNDEAWDPSQLTSFHAKLCQNNIPSAVLVVPEASHAFENMSTVGDPVHLKYVKTGIDFVCRFVGENGAEGGTST